MAKPNNNNKKKGNRPSSLKVIIQQYQGLDTYLATRRPDDIGRDAIRCFRDIAMGNFNADEEGKAFLNPTFINNAVIACNTKYIQASIRLAGENLLLKDPNQMMFSKEQIMMHIDNEGKTVQVYQLLLKMLNDIAYTGDLNNINITAYNINQNRLAYNI